ncbi:MAG TPA: multiheme c-type cytochrome, partial [Nannocystaceae bacterium]|nr:multiheme c-type cytochrome [Nannocystaceae bacterium]
GVVLPWVGTRRWLFAGLAIAAACGDHGGGGSDDHHDDGSISRPRDELLDPAVCAECHPDHYREWLGSMHAYASDDPVFVAMNARGQRETGGELGDFCVKCHAPVAVALGDTKDGLDLEDLPRAEKGITCWFCHSVESVEGTHDNPLVLASDAVMRGEYADAVDNPHHESDYSPLHDYATLASSQLCGSCHDIVNGHGVQLERTYDEWLATFYSKPSESNPLIGASLGCVACHMDGGNGPIAEFEGVESRTRYNHSFPGVDLALTDFPDAEQGPTLLADQQAQVQYLLDPSVCVGLCVHPSDDGEGSEVVVWLHNEFAGHSIPSGAAQDRRMFVQLEAFAGDETVLQSGVLGPQDSVDAAAALDPTLWVLRDRAFGADDTPASMFWEITRVESELLVVAASAELRYDKTTWRSRTWQVDTPVDRAAVEVHMRPIPFELVDELVEDGLDPAVKQRIPTFVLASTKMEWTPETAVMTDCEGPCVTIGTCFANLANGECI